MSQPHTMAGSDLPPFGQSKTLFVQEGNTACILYVRRGPLERVRPVTFVTSGSAFVWCKRRGVGMVYVPVGGEFPDPGRN